MKRLNEVGSSVALVIALAACVVLLLGMSGFGIWAFASRQDFKDNVDAKVATAVEVAKQEEGTAKDKEFVEKEKSPLRDYKGPATYGSLDIQFPRTWSAFVTESATSGQPIVGYFHPNFVPGLQSGTAYALHVVVTNQSYVSELKRFQNNAQAGKVTISAFRAPNVPGVLGSRIDGEINVGQKDSMVLFPIRDKTIEISTESAEFLNDFNSIILPKLTFNP